MVPFFAFPLHFRLKLVDTALFFSIYALQKAVSFLFVSQQTFGSSEEVKEAVQNWLRMQQQVSIFKSTTHISETLKDMHRKQWGNVQANDTAAITLSASSLLTKHCSSFYLTHFHIQKLKLYLAYSNRFTSESPL
jgi:hypothetical protein